MVQQRLPNEPAETLEPLIAWMLEKGGVKPHAYRPSAMQRRVAACLRQLRVKTPGCARQLLERKPELLPFALNTALIGVSEFFRDQQVFDYVKASVLPELFKSNPGIRACSVGVSGGQEIYSLAILLAEAGALDDSELVGIDCRTDAITRAQRGIFNAEDMAGVEPARRERFFKPAGENWAVLPVLKKRIQWHIEDLLSFETEEPFDLILFRNVAIYFNEAHSAEAWLRLCGQLKPGGYVVTGKAEKPPLALPLTRIAPSIYRKNDF